MGAQSSKKKKNKKSGDLADAAEGATSSLTKAIEDTTSAVSSKIEQTTKSVTDVIDTTAKNLTGAAQNASTEANKTAESAMGGVTSAIDQVKESAENTKEQAASASQKAISDATKAVNTTSGAIKSQIEAADSKLQETTSDINKRVRDSTDSAKDTLDKAAHEIGDTAQTVQGSVQKSLLDSKNSAECKVHQLKTGALAKGEELKGSITTTGDALKSNISDLTEQGAATVKQLEITGKENLKNLESQASEAKKSAESKAAELQSTAEGKATAFRNSAEAKANEIKGSAEAKANEFKGLAEAKGNELKGSAEAKAAELKGHTERLSGEVDSKVNELKTSTSEGQENLSSGVEGLKGNLTDLAGNTVGLVKSSAEGLKTAVSGAVGTAVQTASDAAHKTVEGVGKSLGKATSDVSKSLTGAVGNVSGSVMQAAGSATTGLLGKASLASSGLAMMAQSTFGKATDALEDLLPENIVPVCSTDDLKDGEMKVFKVSDEGSILLVKENGEFSALGTKCCHYGAPLSKGVLYNGKLRCPWHGACFNTSTGDIEDSPGLDSLPCYKVIVEDGQVKVNAPTEQLKQNMRIKPLCKKDPEDERTFVIIGGGGAAQVCAETLRQEGYTGNLLMLTKEGNSPYDRPKLSKALTSTGKDLALRNEPYYKNGDIELLLHHEVTSLDVDAKTLQCSNEKNFSFNKVMIATGGQPTTLNVPGNDLGNICYLRTPADANKIAELARDKNAVVLGTSFIGLEVASYLQGKAKSVNVIGRSAIPFAETFGKQVGERLMKLCTEKGIVFHMEAEVAECLGNEDNICAVKLTNGVELPADIFVVGIGVRPATEFLKGGKVPLNERGFIPVNEEMKTSIEDVFGAGDIVEFPLPLFGQEKATIGHWQMAQTQGRQAALSMLGKENLPSSCPFFWCSMFGKSLRYAGYSKKADDFIIDGDVEAMKFVVYVCSGEKVVAVATMGMDPVASNYAALVSGGKNLTKSEIQGDPKAWLASEW